MTKKKPEKSARIAWCIKSPSSGLMISTISMDERTSWEHAMNSAGAAADLRRVDLGAKGYRCVEVLIKEL